MCCASKPFRLCLCEHCRRRMVGARWSPVAPGKLLADGCKCRSQNASLKRCANRFFLVNGSSRPRHYQI